MKQYIENYSDFYYKKIASYIQKNIDYFLIRFKKFDEKKTILSWNWWAFFLPGIYLLYRKVYLWGFLMLIIRIFLRHIPFEGIISGIILGIFANYLIYNRFKILENQALKKNLNEKETLEFLEKNGGVNNLFAVIAIIIMGYQIFEIVYIFINLLGLNNYLY